ncbi:Uncharacterised protein [Mycobacterium tuberculosis]|nr:Uncharacterised protein [Mycobacterium tuberculosis]
MATLDAIGLCGAQEKFRNDRTVPDELATHSGRLAVVDDLGGGTVGEVVLPSGLGQRVEVVVDDVRAQGNREVPPSLSPGEAHHHQLCA